jgi:hypothetical protein
MWPSGESFSGQEDGHAEVPWQAACVPFPIAGVSPTAAVDFMKIEPKHVVGAGVDINLWENIVGGGPFKIKAARRGDSVKHV